MDNDMMEPDGNFFHVPGVCLFDIFGVFTDIKKVIAYELT
ncbi:4778_t:CDS:2 [Funneliformis caledonium]|uniref:4778_t:CDS:1 n=1 Tax=Funneliformis caledonium TaxID=1117310 RepID=A0A9N9E0W8_9GLOM|nr:4778_t:CDS:2 [Funneliformis caledonium]